MVLRHLAMGYGWLADYLDVISAQGYEHAVVESVVAHLQEETGGWDVLDWHELNGSGPTVRALTCAAEKAGLRYLIEPENVSHVIALPTDWEEFLGRLSNTTRKAIARKTRKLIRECEASFEEVCTEQAAREALEALHAFQDKRWSPEQRESRARFMEFMHRIAPAMLQRGWLDLRVLSAHSTPVAVDCNFRYQGTTYAYLSGFDSDATWRPYSVGTVLLAESIRQAIETGCHSFDMGRGDEEYKTSFATTTSVNYRLRIAHTPLVYHSFQVAYLLKNLKKHNIRQLKYTGAGFPSAAVDLLHPETPSSHTGWMQQVAAEFVPAINSAQVYLVQLAAAV
jgi:hypothetical protein